MSDPQTILQVIILAVTGWVLIEVIAHGKTISTIEQKVDDLPCQDCYPQTPKPKKKERQYED